MVVERSSGGDPRPQRRFTDSAAGSQTVISERCVIEGTLTGETNLEIHGRLDGSCAVSGMIVVAQSGRLKGSTSGSDVLVQGEIDGNIEAHGKVELRATARVKGDITAASVAMADGSFFEGAVKMVGDGDAKGVVRFTEKRGDTS